jgi:hypothetical protein
VGTNEQLRESRLFGSMWAYVRRNVVAIFRVYTGYEPLTVFSLLAGILLLAGLAAWTPFLWSWLVHGDRSGHLQSIVLGGVLFMAAVQVFAIGVLADVIAANRIVSQMILHRVRRLELTMGVEPTHYQPGRQAPAANGRVDDGPEAADAAARPTAERAP